MIETWSNDKIDLREILAYHRDFLKAPVFINEFCEKSKIGILVDEDSIPIPTGVRSACDMLGIDPIEIYASEKAIPYLNDQSYNICFSGEPYYSEFLNIEEVKTLKDGDKIKVGKELLLEIIETPGHMPDHITVYDEKNKTAFAGDNPGMQWFADFYVCNSNSIYWQEKEYLESIEKLKSLELDFLCIAHFGVFTGDDIIRFLDESVSMYYKWMELFDQNNNKLDDPKFLIDVMWKTIYKDFNKPIYRQTLDESIEGSVLNALNYYKGLKKMD